MRLLILVALILLVCLCTSKETFFGGYSKPVDVSIDMPSPDLSKYTLSKEPITPDEIQSVVLPSQLFFKNQTGLCVYAIETNKIEKYVSTDDIMYAVRFMFTVTNKGFPYGIGCTFYVKNGTVVSAMTQQPGGSGMTPYKKDFGSTFLSYDDIVAKKIYQK